MSEEQPPGSPERPVGRPPRGPAGQPPGSDPEGPKPFWRRTPFLMAAPPLTLVIIITVVGCVHSGSSTSNPAAAPSSSAQSFQASGSSSPSSSGSAPSFSSPAAASPSSSPAVPSSSPAPEQSPSPYSDGSCLKGDFSGSTPKNVRKVSCRSRRAKYRIIKSFPGATDPSVSQGVPGVEFGYLEEYLVNGVVVESYVYCLGAI
jgi:hypothetical protein